MTPTRLRVVAGAAALLAAWGPALPGADSGRLRVLVQDVSDSAGDEALAGTYPEGFADGLRGARGDRVAVVVFGEGVRLADGPRSPSESAGRAAALPGRRASELAAALRRTAALATQPGLGLDVWVRTDGRATDDARELEDAALALRSAGCVGVRFLGVPAVEFPTVVTALRGPGRAPAGGLFALEAQGRSAGATVVELLREGRPVASRSVASRGPFRVAFTRVERVAGPVRYEARVEGSSLPAALARVRVSAPGGALILALGDLRPGLVEALGRACTAARPDDDAQRLAVSFAAHDLVVVDGVRATEMPTAVTAALDRHVRGGGGLLLLGGPDAFGAGGWAGSPLDDLSPLRSKPEGEEGLLLYVALDGSGSMDHRWSEDGADTRTRDAVVRAAAASLVRESATDTALVLRRFADRLLPDAAAPRPVVLDERGKAAAASAIRGLPGPGGGTALLPVLAEALETSRSAGRARKQALVFTDGRTSEDAAALRTAADALVDSGCALTVVLPADAPSNGARQVLEGTRAVLVDVAAAQSLAAVFRDVEAQARSDEPFLDTRSLVAKPAGSAVFSRPVATRAERLNRTWTAPGTTVLVATGTGEPCAGLRALGRGRVAALATRPGDAAWLDGDGAAALVEGLAAAVARPSGADVRVERTVDGELFVRVADGTPPPAGVAIETGDGRTWRAALLPAGDGLLRAEASPAGAGAGRAAWVRVVGPDGEDLAVVGLDQPVPPEYREPPLADLARLSALSAGPAPAEGAGSRPVLAAAALLLLVLASALEALRPPR